MDPLYQIHKGRRRCPYDPSHTVTAVRFIGHLLKCAKRSTFELSVCPWNATHHVRPEDFIMHVSTCDNRELLDGIGEYAIPDSAYVREYKARLMMNLSSPKREEEIIEFEEKAILLHEPIDTSHDYAVEVYNRRFQTQMLCTRDIDEFDTPPMNTNAQFDHRGKPCYRTKISERCVPPLVKTYDGQFDDNEGDFLSQNGHDKASGTKNRHDEYDENNFYFTLIKKRDEKAAAVRAAGERAVAERAAGERAVAERAAAVRAAGERAVAERAAHPQPIFDVSLPINYVSEKSRFYYGQLLMDDHDADKNAVLLDIVEESTTMSNDVAELPLNTGLKVAKAKTIDKDVTAPVGVPLSQSTFVGLGHRRALKEMLKKEAQRSREESESKSATRPLVAMANGPSAGCDETSSPMAAKGHGQSTSYIEVPRPLGTMPMRHRLSTGSEEAAASLCDLSTAYAESHKLPVTIGLGRGATLRRKFEQMQLRKNGGKGL